MSFLVFSGNLCQIVGLGFIDYSLGYRWIAMRVLSECQKGKD